MLKFVMGLFNKKEIVPEIPIAPSLPELPMVRQSSIKNGLPELPSFPSAPKNENFNREMVKSAIDDKSSDEIWNNQIVPEIPSFSTRPFAAPVSISNTIDSLPTVTMARPVVQSNEPIFVRIDKFQASQKNFNDIRDRVGEIESVLQKIKEVKIKEEEELKGWAEDVEKIKLKLGEIDTDIFSQI